MRMRREHWIASAILSVVAFLACDNDVRYEVVYDCTQDEKLYGDCDGGSSYTCVGASLPGDSDPTLICSSGHPQNGGATEFCCAKPSTSTCSGPGEGCPYGGEGFTCKGLDTPSEHDPSLRCDVGTPQASGEVVFCCTADAGAPGSTCAQEADAGCAFGSAGYDCPSGLVPTTQDPSLHCAAPMFEPSTGDSLYCCSSPDGG